ncbi:uncharacterized protein LOC135688875 [Rhopilema esculentum]|uniref:uncharacterized protein LOC135688875 n=1 Tax=Rhopilema esculentum TaxID=499914 RepID=UPI0031DCD566
MQRQDFEKRWCKNFNVTFELPRYAAKRLRDLAVSGDTRLREIGILKVQVREIRGSSFEEKRRALHSERFSYSDQIRPYFYENEYPLQGDRQVGQADPLEHVAYLSSPPQVVLYNYLNPSQQLIKERHDVRQGIVPGYERGEIRTKIIGISRGVLTEESFPIDGGSLEIVPEWLVKSSLCISFRKHGRCEVACQTGSERVIYRPRPGSGRFEPLQRQTSRSELLWNNNGAYKVYEDSEPGRVHTNPETFSQLASSDSGSAQCSSESILILESLANSLVTSDEKRKKESSIEHPNSKKYEKLAEKNDVLLPTSRAITAPDQQLVKGAIHQSHESVSISNQTSVLSEQDASKVSQYSFDCLSQAAVRPAKEFKNTEISTFNTQRSKEDVKLKAEQIESRITENADVASGDKGEVESDSQRNLELKDTQDSCAEDAKENVPMEQLNETPSKHVAARIDENSYPVGQDSHEVQVEDCKSHVVSFSKVQSVSKVSIQRPFCDGDIKFHGSLPISVNLDLDYLKGITARGNENREKKVITKYETTPEQFDRGQTGEMEVSSQESNSGYVVKRKRGRPPKSGANYIQVPVGDKNKSKKGKQRPIPRVLTTTLIEKETIDLDGDISDNKLFLVDSEKFHDFGEKSSEKDIGMPQSRRSSSSDSYRASSVHRSDDDSTSTVYDNDDDVPLKLIAMRSVEKSDNTSHSRETLAKGKTLKMSTGDGTHVEKATSKHHYIHHLGSPSQIDVDKRVRSRSHRWYQKDSIHRDVEELYNRLYPSVACETDQLLPEDVYYGENYPIIFADDDSVGMKFVDMSTAFKLAMKENLSKKATMNLASTRDDQRSIDSIKGPGKDFKSETDLLSQDTHIFDRMQSRRSGVGAKATKTQSAKKKSSETCGDIEFTVERPHRRVTVDVEIQKPSHRMSLRPRKAVAVGEEYSSSDSFDEDYDDTEPDTCQSYDSDESSDSEPLINKVKKAGGPSDTSSATHDSILKESSIETSNESDMTSQPNQYDVIVVPRTTESAKTVLPYDPIRPSRSTERDDFMKDNIVIYEHTRNDCAKKSKEKVDSSVKHEPGDGFEKQYVKEVVNKADDFNTAEENDGNGTSSTYLKTSQNTSANLPLKNSNEVILEPGSCKQTASTNTGNDNEQLLHVVLSPNVVEDNGKDATRNGKSDLKRKGNTDDAENELKETKHKTEKTESDENRKVSLEKQRTTTEKSDINLESEKMESSSTEVIESKRKTDEPNEALPLTIGASGLGAGISRRTVTCENVQISAAGEEKTIETRLSRNSDKNKEKNEGAGTLPVESEEGRGAQNDLLGDNVKASSCDRDKGIEEGAKEKSDMGSLSTNEIDSKASRDDKKTARPDIRSQVVKKIDVKKGHIRSGKIENVPSKGSSNVGSRITKLIKSSIEKVAHSFGKAKEGKTHSQGRPADQEEHTVKTVQGDKSLSQENLDVSKAKALFSEPSKESHKEKSELTTGTIDASTNGSHKLNVKSKTKESTVNKDITGVCQLVDVAKEKKGLGRETLAERTKSPGKKETSETYDSSKSFDARVNVTICDDSDTQHNGQKQSSYQIAYPKTPALPLKSPLLADEAPKFDALSSNDARDGERFTSVEEKDLHSKSSKGSLKVEQPSDSKLHMRTGSSDNAKGSGRAETAGVEGGCDLGSSENASQLPHSCDVSLESAWKPAANSKSPDSPSQMSTEKKSMDETSMLSVPKKKFEDIDAAKCLLGLFDQNQSNQELSNDRGTIPETSTSESKSEMSTAFGKEKGKFVVSLDQGQSCAKGASKELNNQNLGVSDELIGKEETTECTKATEVEHLESLHDVRESPVDSIGESSAVGAALSKDEDIRSKNKGTTRNCDEPVVKDSHLIIAGEHSYVEKAGKSSLASEAVCGNIFESLAREKLPELVSDSKEKTNNTSDERDGNIFENIGLSSKKEGHDDCFVEKKVCVADASHAKPEVEASTRKSVNEAKLVAEEKGAESKVFQGLSRTEETVDQKSVDSGDRAGINDRILSRKEANCTVDDSIEQRPGIFSVLSTSLKALDHIGESGLSCSEAAVVSTRMSQSKRKLDVADKDDPHLAIKTAKVEQDEHVNTDKDDLSTGELKLEKATPTDEGCAKSLRPCQVAGDDGEEPKVNNNLKETEKTDDELIPKRTENRVESRITETDNNEIKVAAVKSISGKTVSESTSHIDSCVSKQADFDSRSQNVLPANVESDNCHGDPEVIEKTQALQSISTYKESSDEESEDIVDKSSASKKEQVRASAQDSDCTIDGQEKGDSVSGGQQSEEETNRSEQDGGQMSADEVSSEDAETGSKELQGEENDNSVKSEAHTRTRKRSFTEGESIQKSDGRKRRKSTTDSESADASHIVLTRSMRRQSGSPAKRLRSSKY